MNARRRIRDLPRLSGEPIAGPVARERGRRLAVGAPGAQDASPRPRRVPSMRALGWGASPGGARLEKRL
jgi:hypothetical protein